jgi:hypothetical protein
MAVKDAVPAINPHNLSGQEGWLAPTQLSRKVSRGFAAFRAERLRLSGTYLYR